MTNKIPVIDFQIKAGYWKAMNKAMRWKQRFANFEKSFAQLEKAVQIKTLSQTERAGLIQFFELTFELAFFMPKY